MDKTKKFKELVHAEEILILPCCHDGLSAKVFEEAGFEAICAAGYGTTGSLLGKPDIGLLAGMEIVNQYRNIVNAVGIPVFLDLDTGYGDVNNVIRIVSECERMGAAGILLEDQTWPKRCGHMEGKSVVPVEEYLPKLKAALDCKKNIDFSVMARTDAASVIGVDEAIRRAKLYAETGADLLFVESLKSEEEMKKVNGLLKELNVPIFANMVEGGKTPILPADKLQKLGYNVALYPCSSVYTVVKSMRELAQFLKKNKTTIGFEEKMIDFNEYFKFIDAGEIREEEKKFY